MTLQVLPQISSTPVLVKALRQGTLLRVQLDRTAKLKVGTPVSGHLIDPVFLFDREVLPSGALITGYVVGASYVPAKGRIWQLLNGDITTHCLRERCLARRTYAGNESPSE
jgi:hypothetical protein